MQPIDLVLILIAFAFVALLGAAGLYDTFRRTRFRDKESQS